MVFDGVEDGLLIARVVPSADELIENRIRAELQFDVRVLKGKEHSAVFAFISSFQFAAKVVVSQLRDVVRAAVGRKSGSWGQVPFKVNRASRRLGDKIKLHCNLGIGAVLTAVFCSWICSSKYRSEREGRGGEEKRREEENVACSEREKKIRRGKKKKGPDL